MKTSPSRYILIAEILAIVLFHIVKLKHKEEHLPETVFVKSATLPLQKPVVENRSEIKYMLVNLIK